YTHPTASSALSPSPFPPFFFQCSLAPRDLHSFPTRRSSDLRLTGHRGNRRPSREATHAALSSQQHARVCGFLNAEIFPNRDRGEDRKSTRLNSSHVKISYAVFCLKKKRKGNRGRRDHDEQAQ